MKAIACVLFLILVSVQLGTSQEFYFLLENIKSFARDFAKNFFNEFKSPECPGYCLSEGLSKGCPLVYTNAGCPGFRVCCAFSLHIDLSNRPPLNHLTKPELIANTEQDTNISIKDQENHVDDIIQTTNVPPTTYKTTEDLDVVGEENKIGAESDINKKGINSCPGVCLETSFTKYCEAYLTSTSLCQTGKLCCVSKSEYENYYPLDLVEVLESTPFTEPLPTMPPITSDPVLSPARKCTGQCLNGLFIFFCDEIDNDASCPSDGSCCLSPKTTTVGTS